MVIAPSSPLGEKYEIIKFFSNDVLCLCESLKCKIVKCQEILMLYCVHVELSFVYPGISLSLGTTHCTLEFFNEICIFADLCLYISPPLFSSENVRSLLVNINVCTPQLKS